MAEKSDPQRDRSRLMFRLSLILIVTTFLAFVPTLKNDFVNYDDDIFILQNRHLRAGLTAQGVRWALTDRPPGDSHPLTSLSFLLDYQLYGLNPTGFHLSTANVWLLFWLLARLTGSVWRSALVAAFFGLHPLRVESVAWALGRKDVLSTFFWMLALWAYVWYVANPQPRRYLFVGLALVLGLMAKSMLVTLPCVLLLLDYWPLGRFQPGASKTSRLGDQETRRPGDKKNTTSIPLFPGLLVSRSPCLPLSRLIYEKLPLVGVISVFSVITFMTERQAGTLIELQRMSLGIRVGNALVSYCTYLAKTIWPMRLAAFYPHPLDTLPVVEVIGAAVLVAAISALVLWQARRRPFWSVGWFWFLGTLFPVIGIVQYGGAALADRYSYIPHIGLFMAAVWGFGDLLANRKILRLSLPVLLLIGSIFLTARQARVWRDSGTLWEHALQVTSHNALAHQNLGAFLQQQGKLTLASDHYRAALQISPQLGDAYRNLGECYFQWGRETEALDCYRAALAINPRSTDVHNHLGELLFKQGDLRQAADHFGAALTLDPDSTVAHINLGAVVFHQGDTEGAIQHYRAALEIDPDSAEAYSNLGEISFRQGRLPEAIQHFRAALKTNPKLAGAENNLGAVLLQQGKWQEAEPHFRAALKIDPSLVSAHANLGFILQAQGRLEEAGLHFTVAAPTN
jgi:tetratricopeptide (TPR) repeat protein